MRCSPLVPGLLALGAIGACSRDSATGIQGLCDVTNPVTSITVTPPNATLYYRSPPRAGDSLQLVPVAFGRFDNPRSDVPFSYRSSDTKVAAVSDAGVVTPRSTGSSTVTVSSCDREARVEIVVISDVAAVVVAPANDTLVEGDSLALGAWASDPGGAALSGVVFSWSADPATVATLAPTSDSSVMAHALAPGTVMVNAAAEGTRGTASIVVVPREFLAGTAGTAPGMDAGLDYTCAAISLGRGYCWGVDGQGQLGAPADSSCFEASEKNSTLQPCSLLPQRFAPELAFTTLSSGSSSACGITADGLAYCWGANSDGQLGNGLQGGSAPSLVTGALSFRSITVGRAHACGVASDGTAYCWGQDTFGQLGDGRTVNSTTPIPVVVDQATGSPVEFASLSAGLDHTCGIASTGAAYCWGSNAQGQLGTAATGETCGAVATPCSSVPVEVDVPEEVSFVALSGGSDHSCGITAAGAAYCWGSDSLGQLGDGQAGPGGPSPVAVAGGHSFAQISAGVGFTCALERDIGAAWCWGYNGDLELGIGQFSGSDSLRSAPAPVGGEHRFAVVSAGARHACGVATDGRAYCWGSNVFGALGNTQQAAFRGSPQEVATPR